MVSLAAGIITESLVPAAKKRGMKLPVLAVGDGALGFCAAVRDVFPETRRRRDWVHKTSNGLDALSKSIHSRAKSAIKEITRNISVCLYGNGILLGAMTYQLDPDLTEPSGGKRRPRVE
jgi:hypothetical protein